MRALSGALSKVSMWKFPGGLSELNEDIGSTAEREVLEETGVRSSKISIELCVVLQVLHLSYLAV